VRLLRSDIIAAATKSRGLIALQSAALQSSSLRSFLRSTKVVVASHEFGDGPPQALEQYLAPLVRKLLCVYLPMTYAPDRRPRVRVYRAGQLTVDR